MKPSIPHVKGTDLVAIRKMLGKKGEDVQERFIAQLSAESAKLFKNIIPSHWVPNALATEMMEKAAKILFPHDNDDLEKLGGACAEQAFTGIYRAFLSLTTVPFLIKNVPLVWSMYHSVGKAAVTVREDKQGATLVVKGASGVMVNNLRLVGGFSARALEMAGAKSVTFKLNTSDPENRIWTFNWILK